MVLVLLRLRKFESASIYVHLANAQISVETSVSLLFVSLDFALYPFSRVHKLLMLSSIHYELPRGFMLVTN